MVKLLLDIEKEDLKEELKRFIIKVDYPLRFENIIISTSYKTDFLSGEARKNMEIIINPENKFLENKILFRGYLARFFFLLINEREGLNREIKNKLEIPKLVEFVQNFFADYKAIKYGFRKEMYQFFLERITKKLYSTESISKEEYLEFYSFYLILKKIGGEEIKSILDSIKIEGVEFLIKEIEKLNYPFLLGSDDLKKEWMEIFNF